MVLKEGTHHSAIYVAAVEGIEHSPPRCFDHLEDGYAVKLRPGVP
jgi:hypothetical protein